MNLDQLCQTILNNKHRLKNWKKTLIFLKYHFNLLEIKKKKLKLGAVIFEIKKTMFYTTVIREDLQLRYIRQDTTAEDERRLETILDRLAWKWDVRNAVALVVVIALSVAYIFAFLNLQYQKYLPTLAFRSAHYDYILRQGLKLSFLSPFTESTDSTPSLNYWVVDTLSDFAIYFNVIF